MSELDPFGKSHMINDVRIFESDAVYVTALISDSKVYEEANHLLICGAF